MSARSARRPVPALVFLLALAILAVVVWVRVADRDSGGDRAQACATAPELPINQAVTVTVLNGVGTDGLATTVLDAFASLGFGKGNVGDADGMLPGVATVTAGPNGTAGALLVSYFLPGSTVNQDGREDASVTVTVGQKFRSLATGAQVKAAMAKAMLSQSAPPPKPAAATPSPAAATTRAAATPTATCTTTPPVPTPPSATPAASSPAA